MPPERLISARKVATLFGVGLKTLHNWEDQDLLIPERINRRRYYRPSDVEALVAGEPTPVRDAAVKTPHSPHFSRSK